MNYDYQKLYYKNAAFFVKHTWALRILMRASSFLTGFFALAFGAFLVYGYFTEIPLPDFLQIVEFPVLCLFLIGLLRTLFERPRPYSEKGANIKPFLRKPKGENQSFPSRHTACAFVISTVIFGYLPWAGICLMPFTLALAYVRFTLGLHYPSDLVGGAILGILCGVLPFLF